MISACSETLSKLRRLQCLVAWACCDESCASLHLARYLANTVRPRSERVLQNQDECPVDYTRLICVMLLQYQPKWERRGRARERWCIWTTEEARACMRTRFG